MDIFIEFLTLDSCCLCLYRYLVPVPVHVLGVCQNIVQMVVIAGGGCREVFSQPTKCPYGLAQNKASDNQVPLLAFTWLNCFVQTGDGAKGG